VRSGWPWDPEHVVEELVEDVGGLVPVGDLVPAESVDLVSGEPESAAGGDHLGAARRAGAGLAIGVVLKANDRKDDAMAYSARNWPTFEHPFVSVFQ